MKLNLLLGLCFSSAIAGSLALLGAEPAYANCAPDGGPCVTVDTEPTEPGYATCDEGCHEPPPEHEPCNEDCHAPRPGPSPCQEDTCAPMPHPPSAAPCYDTPCSGYEAQDYYHEVALPGEFVCEADGHVPTTVFYAPEGRLEVIRWVSHYFAGSGYTPEVRCRDVSQRFQRFYEVGILNYVTTGIVNRLPVVCVSTELGGPCTGVLFTLRPDENASQVVQQLFDISYANAGPLYESGSRIYLDMNEFLNQVQANR